MAYDTTKLSVLAYTNGFTIWHYRSPDSMDGIADAPYFQDAANMLRVGDMIIVDSAEIHTIVFVTLNDGKTVRISGLCQCNKP